MDFTSIVGLIAGLGLIIFGIVYDPSSGIAMSTLINFINYPSMAITFGGAIAATLIAFPISYFKGMPKHMIVTRAASDSSLSSDVSKQFFSQPTVLILTGITLIGLCFIPGMPIIQLIILAAALLIAGFTVKKKQELAAAAPAASLESEQSAAAQDESTYFKNIDNIYELLQIDAIEMEFGYSLIPLVDENSGSSFIERLITFRKQFAMEMGMVIPAVRLRDNGMLNPNQYVIKIKGEEVSRGEILIDYYLALDPGNLTGGIDGIETIEPAYGIPSKWITKDKKEMAEIYGYTVIDPLSVVVTHLSETVKKYAHAKIRPNINSIIY